MNRTLKKYRKEADAYFQRVGICPDGEEILEFVVERVADESGCDVDESTYTMIAKQLGITTSVGKESK